MQYQLFVLKEKYGDVFREDMTTFRGTQVHIKVTEIIPKCFEARLVPYVLKGSEVKHNKLECEDIYQPMFLKMSPSNSNSCKG